MSRPRLSYVVPVHNQELVLRLRMTALAHRLREFPGSEILLVENGSADGSAQLVEQLSEELDGKGVRVAATTSTKGFGAALRLGMQLATGDTVILTAADLPFDFTDLDGWLAAGCPQLGIGSKAHPDSVVDVSIKRALMSRGFRWARGMLLDLQVADSQSVTFVDIGLVRRVLPRLRCEGFLITTEVIAWAVWLGATPVEFPVVYPRKPGRSTVRPVRDALNMAWGLLELRHRLGGAPAR